jgi:hypothetical protein
MGQLPPERLVYGPALPDRTGNNSGRARDLESIHHIRCNIFSVILIPGHPDGVEISDVELTPRLPTILIHSFPMHLSSPVLIHTNLSISPLLSLSCRLEFGEELLRPPLPRQGRAAQAAMYARALGRGPMPAAAPPR